MNDDQPRIRLRVIGVVSVSLLVALVARLWFLQVMNSESYEQRAIANTERVVRVPAPRGRIFDAQGRVLVDNKTVTMVSIDKAELERALPSRKAEARKDMLTRLAVEISKSGQLVKVDDIERKLRNSQYSRLGEVPIALDVQPDLMVLLGENPQQFPGVKVGQTTIRDYPYGTRAAHLLGYVGPINDTEFASKKDSPKRYDLNDQIGKSGIESLFEDVLRGTPGSKVYEVDRQERVIGEVSEKDTEPIPGQDIYLTVDISLQNLVEQELETALIEARKQPKRQPTDPEITAPAGAAVLLNPQDGSVLAMASYPTYDPADFVAGISQEAFNQLNDAAKFNPILNRAIQGEYAPGSTFKLFTAYAAIENGFMGTGRLPAVYQRRDDSGTYVLDPCRGEKCNWDNSKDGAGRPLTYKSIDLPTAITVSSDTYFYAIGAEIGRSQDNDHAIQDAAAKFGLGLSTGVQLPGERTGRIADRELKKQLHNMSPGAFPEGNWFTGDNINAAVGQGLTVVTPLQLANAYGAFGNGGTVYAPNLVKEVRDHVTGQPIVSFGPRTIGKVDIPQNVRDPILQGLVGVTSSDGAHRGTAFGAFHDPAAGVVFGPGMPSVAGKTGTAEVKGKADSALFAGFMPADNPHYAMAVVLEQSGFGGANAAPVVAKVYDAIAENKVKDPLTVPELYRCIELLRSASSTTSTTTTPSTTTTTARSGKGGTTTTTTTTTAAPPPPVTLPSGKSCQ
jgi:penicillin-binding protein 2